MARRRLSEDHKAKISKGIIATTVRRRIEAEMTSSDHGEDVKRVWRAVERSGVPLTYEVERLILDLAQTYARRWAALRDSQPAASPKTGTGNGTGERATRPTPAMSTH
jgi:hypothetical protein